MIRPEKSRDGIYRSTVRVEFRVDASVLELAAIMAVWDRNGDVSEIGSLGKGEVEEAMRDGLYRGGLHWVEWGSEVVDPAWLKQAERLAESTIRALYPDMFEETRMPDGP